MDIKNTESSKVKLHSFKSKLKAIDSHIRTTERLPDTFFMHPQLIDQIYDQKPGYQIKNKLKLRQRRTVIFKGFNIASFQFDYLPLSKDKKYCLHVNPSNIMLNVQIVFDGQRKRFYEIKKEQTIMITEQQWNNVVINIRCKNTANISIVNIQMDTIVTQFKGKKSQIAVVKKKTVQQQLQEYLKVNLNPDRIKEIIQKRKNRSLSRLAQMKSGQLSTGLISRKGSLTNFRSIGQEFARPVDLGLYSQKQKTVQLKKDLISFEESKQKYLKHFEKMSPSKAVQIQQFQEQYNKEKHYTLKKFTSLIYMVKFLKEVKKSQIQISKIKAKKVKVSMICKQFYRRLSNNNKMKLTFRTRNKLASDLNLSAISCLLYEQNIEKAENRITQCFKNIMYKIDFATMTQRSETYIHNVIKAQRFLRKKRDIYIDRFTILSEIIKGRIFDNNKEKIECFVQYMQACKQHPQPLKYGFIIHHKQIDAILMKFRGDQQKEFAKFVFKKK